MLLNNRYRTFLTGLVRKAASLFGSRLKSADGRTLDRAFILPFGGGISLLGISPYSCLKPVGVIQSKMTYWKQSIRWEEASAPDFDRIRPAGDSPQPGHLCHAIISHLDAGINQRLLAEWSRLDPDSTLLLVHGGKRADYDALPPSVNKIFVDDERLRTRVHAKEKQEYHSIIRGIAAWLPDHPKVTHVYLVEYDCVPLAPDLGRKLLDFLAAQNADLAGSALLDITGSIHPHYLNFLADDGIMAYLKEISGREDKARVLTMLGCTSVWSAACLVDVAAQTPPGKIYLEMAFPTLAHHLGWRVRPFPASQQESMSFQDDLWDQAEAFREKGAWMIHPCKAKWVSPAPDPSV